MSARSRYLVVVASTGLLLVLFGAPSWLALVSGLVVALVSGQRPPAALKRLTTYSLQLGVVALGADREHASVARST